MQAKLKAQQDWHKIDQDSDPILLLKAIKEITQNYQDDQYPIATVHKAIFDLVTIKQREDESLYEYGEHVKNKAELVEAHNGGLVLKKYVQMMSCYTAKKADEFKEKAFQQFVAYGDGT